MNDPDGPIARYLWPLLASVAGAITALSFRPWDGMNRGEICMALFVGASFAYFVSPIALGLVFGSGPIDAKTLGGFYYIMASGSNALIPMAVRWLGRVFGTKEAEK